MKAHTSDFKNALKGMVIDKVAITYGNTTLGTDEIIDIEFYYEGSLLKTMMKGLTITSTEDIAKDTIINFKYSLYIEKEPPAVSGYEDLDFGNYVVVSSEKNEDADNYTITCYDKLIYSAVDYVDLGLTYPITLGNYLSAICTHLGLTLSTSTFTNSTMEIPSELYLDIGYKFRDVLDEISQATGTSICLNSDDEVELRVPTATNDTIDEDFISDLTTKFKEKYGPINTLVLSRSAESDNLYYPSILPANPVEIKITDNQILNGEDREDYMAGIASNIFDIEFYQNDFTSPGILYYDFLDMYNVSIDGTTYNCIMFNDDISIANKIETIHSDIPQFSETDYSQASSTDRTINRALLTVNKATAEIDAKVSKDDIIADLNLAIINGQGVINATGNTFILNADNASIDAEGNAEFNDAKLRGGNLVLEDDGTEENASIKILQTGIDNKIYIDGMPLENFKLAIDCQGMSYNDLAQFDGENLIRFYDSDNEINYYLVFHCGLFNSVQTVYLELGSPSTYYYTYFTKPYDTFVTQEWETTLPSSLLEGTTIFDFTTTDLYTHFYFLGDKTTRETTYSGQGLTGEVIPQTLYNQHDQYRIIEILQGDTPTAEDLQKYDFDGDGEITFYDSQCLNEIIGLNTQSPAIFKIDYKNPLNIISAYNPSTGRNSFEFGLTGIKTHYGFLGTIEAGYSTINTVNINTGLNLEKNAEFTIFIDDSNFINVRNALMPSIRTVGLNSNTSYTISSTYGHTLVKCNVDLMNLNNPGGLVDRLNYSSADGYITIGTDVRHVRVSGNIMMRGIAGALIGEIQKTSGNSTSTISANYATANSTGAWVTVALTPKVIAVSANDIIKLTVGSGTTGTLTVAGGGGQMSYLNIEVVD